ncbi:putative Late embryogenesis abundant protein, LEA-14 [Rosa chinensis]|uniref:Putative Late embryogenesis abundant protein, LEA-14 n=1 Tax=Rosa chinensis TaxID=74649 RepID=A0A2P6PAE8_ROSCH|nr:uncharacterized protein LOC112177734 [Rosa chinensis]PRQ18906.1 putative Late embryogenesis abundant protein, LEA-14 [Rosa chinensis]
MEINLKVLEGQDNSPLLPVSDNPNSNPYVQRTMKARYIFEVRIVHLLILIVTFWAVLCLPSFFTSMSLVPQTPSFQFDSLFLSNFNISNKTIGANLDMTLQIENPNSVTKIHFNIINGSISYKDNSLAMYSIKPFELGYREHRLVHLKISKYQTMEKNGWVLDEINKQRDENGAVSFSLTMFVSATYTTGWWGIKKFVSNPQCLDLRVAFLPKAGFGNWVNGGPMKCSLPIF